jgi:hypothetical protein
MPLSGTFDTIQLNELSQWIHSAKKSGTLSISVELEETHLVFKNGELVAVSSEGPLQLDLKQVLLTKKIVSEAQYQKAQDLCQQGESPLQKLVSMGALDESLLTALQAEHVFEIVLDLFFLEDGSFHFSPSTGTQGLLVELEPNQSNLLQQPISTQALLMEGMHRIDKWTQIRKVFPDGYVVIKAEEGESDNPVWKELCRLGKPLSIGELCLHMDNSRFEIYRQAFEGYSKNIISITSPSLGQSHKRNLESVDVLIDSARVLLHEDQFDEARQVLMTAANLEPENTTIRSLLRQTREGQLRYLYQLVPPHRTLVLSCLPEKLATHNLSPKEKYLASRLSGSLDTASLVVTTPLGELDTLRILRKLLHTGIVRFSG